jgi:hypothetical protein
MCLKALSILTFSILMTTTFPSCGSDRLTLYTSSYKPILNSKLRFDGYYADRQESFQLPTATDTPRQWTNPITPKFFFEDGSVAYLPTHENEQQLTETFTKYKGGLINWGVFQTFGDTLTAEILQPNSGTMRKERFTNKFIIKKPNETT